jgi:hypothetical protein
VPTPTQILPAIHLETRIKSTQPSAASTRFALCLASQAGCKMARVYADVNQQMPRSYWDYDSVNITWGILENYEVVRKIGKSARATALETLARATFY